MGVWEAVILAHLLYDFHWQGDFIGLLKGKYDFLLFVHTLTWTLLIGFVLQYYGLFAYWKFGFLLATHFVIDRWKSHKSPDDAYKLTRWLWIDQVLHLITLLIVICVEFKGVM